MARLSALCLALCFGAAVTAAAQQVAPGLQQGLSALNGAGGTGPTDVTLTGSVTWNSGGQTKQGTVTFTATSDAAGSSQAVFTLPNETLTEQWTSPGGVAQGRDILTGHGPNGLVSGPAGGSIAMPGPAWFSPAMLLARVTGAGYASEVAPPSPGQAASPNHLRVWRSPPGAAGYEAFALRQTTQTDLYLDPSTGLPQSAVFLVQPYHKPGQPPPSPRARPAQERVTYSDYQVVQGRPVPFQIQVSIGLKTFTTFMTITVTKVSFDTGATIAPLQ